jgi:hypothetical protein
MTLAGPRIRTLAVCLVVGLAIAGYAGAAWASEGEAAKAHGDAHSGDAKSDAKGNGISGLFGNNDKLVPLPTLIVPVTVNGRLIAHLYMYLAAMTGSAAESAEVKKRMPYVQDAMVLEAYRDAPTVADRDQDPDPHPLLLKLKDVINKAVGKPVVTGIQVGRIDTAPY